jgi:plasmid stabilization system protein ParE
VSEPLHVEVSELAAGHIRAAEAWWRSNRPKAPNAIREELERASSLIAVQPGIGTRARNATLPGVRRVHLARIRYDLYYRVVEEPKHVELLAFWHASRGSGPQLE